MGIYDFHLKYYIKTIKHHGAYSENTHLSNCNKPCVWLPKRAINYNDYTTIGQRTLTLFVRGSITVCLTSCLTG